MNMQKEIFFSYAYEAEKEDLILYHALKNIKKGFYIDVGACSSIDGSVTKALYDMGWCGINIEPQQFYYTDLQKNRPRDINLNVGVSNTGKELALYGQGALATFSERIVKYHQEMEGSGNEVSLLGKVATQSLREICEHYLPHENGSPITVHFCKIDVEGFECQVLLSHDFQNYRPWVFVVEATLPNSDIPSYDEWEYILLNNGYVFVLAYGSNRYYVDCCKTDIIERLNAITGEEYLTSQYDIFHIDSRKIESYSEGMVVSQLFVDEGNGFTEFNKMIKEIVLSDDKTYTARFDLSDLRTVQALRFDPLEGCYCDVEILSARDAHGAVLLEPLASVRMGETDRFLTTDPQYFVPGPCEGFLEIQFYLCALSLFEAEQAVYNYVWKQSELAARRDELLDQRSEQIEWQAGQISRQKQLLDELNVRIGERDELLGQQSELIEWQACQISRQEQLLNELNVRIGERDTLIGQQGGQIEALSRQIEDIENSVYWKITVPVRKIVELLKRFRKGNECNGAE